MPDEVVQCAACRSIDDVQMWSPLGPEDFQMPMCGACREFYRWWLPAATNAVISAIDKVAVEKIEEEMNRNAP